MARLTAAERRAAAQQREQQAQERAALAHQPESEHLARYAEFTASYTYDQERAESQAERAAEQLERAAEELRRGVRSAQVARERGNLDRWADQLRWAAQHAVQCGHALTLAYALDSVGAALVAAKDTELALTRALAVAREEVGQHRCRVERTVRNDLTMYAVYCQDCAGLPGTGEPRPLAVLPTPGGALDTAEAHEAGR